MERLQNNQSTVEVDNFAQEQRDRELLLEPIQLNPGQEEYLRSRCMLPTQIRLIDLIELVKENQDCLKIVARVFLLEMTDQSPKYFQSVVRHCMKVLADDTQAAQHYSAQKILYIQQRVLHRKRHEYMILKQKMELFWRLVNKAKI